MIKAIIFDFDGTILDTETPWYYVFRDAYKEHGVELPLDMYAQCVGTHNSSFNPYDYLITEKGLPIDREAFKARINKDLADRIGKQLVREGILDYLNSAREAGLRIGLASSSDRRWIDRHLEQLGIAHYFETIQTSDDVRQVKPDPELYLRALDALGVRPEEAVAIEDSPNGARAASAAGMGCIVVPNEITSLLSFDQDAGCIHAVSLSHIDFEALIAGKL